MQNQPARRFLAAPLALALLTLAACRRDEADPVPVPPAAPAKTAGGASYELRGVVRIVDADAGQATIRHEAIPGFMAAMTMPFAVDDKELLGDLRPGDEVEGRLDVEMAGDSVRSYRLRDLKITRPATSPPVEGPAAAPALLGPGDPVPDFAFLTQTGTPGRLSEYRGSYVIFTFLYTRCPLPDFCPLLDRKFGELAARIGRDARLRDRVRLLSVSFDPEHDTPEVLARHALRNRAVPPLWTFAVAQHEELAKVAPGLGLTYGPGANEILHNLVTVAIDPEGRVLAVERGREWSPGALLRGLPIGPDPTGGTER